MRWMLRSKIHRATVTQTRVDYEGSITVDEDLLDRAGIWVGEKVLVADVDNGSRFETYTLPGKRGSGVIAIKNRYGVAGAISVTNDDQAMLLTKTGQTIRIPVKDIRVTGRAAQGVRLMNIDAKSGEEVVGICKVVLGEDDEKADAK